MASRAAARHPSASPYAPIHHAWAPPGAPRTSPFAFMEERRLPHRLSRRTQVLVLVGNRATAAHGRGNLYLGAGVGAARWSAAGAAAGQHHRQPANTQENAQETASLATSPYLSTFTYWRHPHRPSRSGHPGSRARRPPLSAQAVSRPAPRRYKRPGRSREPPAETPSAGSRGMKSATGAHPGAPRPQ